MRKGFLLKLIFLVLLAVMLAGAVAVMRQKFVFAAAQSSGEQTFFEQFVMAGGPIVWFVLLPMSLVMVFLAADYSISIRRKKLLPEGISKTMIELIQQFGIGQLAAKIRTRTDFVSVAVVRAVTQGRGDFFRMRSVMGESLQDQAWGLMRKIEWINLIGNVSPMVGLFGTVFGMIKLFNAIVTAGGQPQPAQLADGISVALVTTFWGLFIAIPALAVYGVFRNRIETLVSEAVSEAEDVTSEIRRELKKQLVLKQRPGEKSRLAVREIKGKQSRSADKSVLS